MSTSICRYLSVIKMSLGGNWGVQGGEGWSCGCIMCVGLVGAGAGGGVIFLVIFVLEMTKNDKQVTGNKATIAI